jgi:hypothetical protein
MLLNIRSSLLYSVVSVVSYSCRVYLLLFPIIDKVKTNPCSHTHTHIYIYISVCTYDYLFKARRRTICRIATIVVAIIECLLMCGIILCIAYCSAYISLSANGLEKGNRIPTVRVRVTSIRLLFRYTRVVTGDIARWPIDSLHEYNS